MVFVSYAFPPPPNALATSVIREGSSQHCNVHSFFYYPKFVNRKTVEGPAKCYNVYTSNYMKNIYIANPHPLSA